MLCKILVVMGTCIVVVSRVMYYMSCFERLSTRVLCLICCGNLYCRRVVLIIAMLYLVSFCELFLKALFTCVFQVELIKVSTLRGPCFACNRATARFFLGKECQKSADLRRATVGLSPDDRTEIGR